MKKSSRHRRRHTPPGPCGVLWTMTKKKSKLREEEEEFTTTAQGEKGNDNKALFSQGESHGSPTIDNNNSRNKKGMNHHDDASTPPAWMAMLRSLDLPTPYIPVSANTLKRYQMLRPHLPGNCILLQEILCGSHDLQISSDQYLCAWVDTVEERNSHHGIWTVGLKDETGATIRAWMEPNFVREELQKAQTDDHSKGVVKVGVVWMLSNFSMIAFHNQNNNSGGGNNNGSVERMLVVSGKHIRRVWTPDRAQHQPNEEEDSPEAQRKFLDWMEKRKALTVDDENDENPDHHNKRSPEHDRMEEEEEDDDHDDEWDRHSKRQHRANSRQSNQEQSDDDDASQRRIVGGKEQQVRMTEMSALTMTADEENLLTSTLQDERTSNNSNHFSTTNGLEKLPPMHPTSPMAHRDLNQRDSNRSIVSTTSGQKNNMDKRSKKAESGDNHGASSVLLQTQESSPAMHQLDANSGQKKNRHTPSSQELSPQQHPANTASRGTSKRKNRKKKDHTSPLRSPKRGKKDKSPACTSSPIRMSQSVWNTPDPSILQMLEEDSDASMGEVETPTVVCDEGPSLSFNPTQCSNKLQSVPETSRLDNLETNGSGRMNEQESPSIEREGDILLTGRALLGKNLFEPSNWTGVDSTAFSDSDSE